MRSPSSKHLSPLTKLNHFDEFLILRAIVRVARITINQNAIALFSRLPSTICCSTKSLAGIALSKLARSKLALDRHTNWATYTCTPEATVAAGVLREVLLMIIFSEVKLRCCEDFGCNFAVLRLAQSLLVGITRCFC